MRSLRGSALGAVVLALAISSAGAAVEDLPQRAHKRPLVVHPRPPRPAAATLGVTVAPGLMFATPFTVVAGDPDRLARIPHYQGPDGTYDEQADFIRSVNGTPCGQECTRLSLRRWGYEPVD